MKRKTISDNLFNFSNEIDDFKSRYNEEVRDAFSLFKEIYTKFARKRLKLIIRYIYASEGSEVHPNVKQQGEELKKHVKQWLPEAKAEVEFVGAAEFMNLIRISEEQDYELHLVNSPISLDDSKDYIGLVSLKKYYDFITDEAGELNQAIFESNIRDYQGNVSVNTEIRSTLAESDTKGVDFWWLNNGITIVAKDVRLLTKKSLLITYPEIVNGLQTKKKVFQFLIPTSTGSVFFTS